MPLVSVIIPVYNGDKTIRDTIESVLNQTFSDFELIVINDGSQDATLEIVKSIQDSRIKVFSYANAGQAASRNRGFSHSVGEYISFLDTDDLWTTDKLEAQLKALHENPQAAVAYSWTDYINESSQFIRPGSHISMTGNVLKKLFVVNFLENGSNPLIRRQALAEVGGFDGSITPAEDWDMWLRLAVRYQFVAVPFAQVLYRVYANSSSSNVSRMEAGALKAIAQALTQSPESLQHLHKQSLANLYKYLTWKALDGTPERHKALIAVRFLWYAISNDSSLLYKRIIWKVLLKIAIAIFLPPQQALVLLKKMGQRSNLNTLLSYIQIEVS